MLGEKYDLPRVVREMREMPVDRAQHRVRLRVDRDPLPQIFQGQRLESRECESPGGLPARHEGLAGLPLVQKLAVPLPVILVSVRRQEVREAGVHVPAQVLQDDRNRVRLGVQAAKKIRVADLLERSLHEFFVAAQAPQSVREIAGQRIALRGGVPGTHAPARVLIGYGGRTAGGAGCFFNSSITTEIAFSS